MIAQGRGNIIYLSKTLEFLWMFFLKKSHSHKVLQGASHRRRSGSAFSVRVVKYWNKLPASVVTAPSVNVFKKRLEKVGLDISLSPYHPLTEHSSLNYPTPPPIPPAHHLLTVIISICYPNRSSGPLWPTFCHYKSQSNTK